MSKPSEFLCTERCIRHIEVAKLPLYALRLVHACHYYIDQTPGLSMQNMALHPKKHYTARCQSLLEATGTPQANDFDMIKEGLAALQDSQLFSHLELSENGRKLIFHLAKHYADDAVRKKSDKFAFVDVDIIRTLRTPEQILFYTRCAMVLRSDYPMFTLPWAKPDKGCWLDDKKRWLSAACRISKRLELDCVLIPHVDVETDEVSRVKVKLVQKVSHWAPGKLFPRDGEGVVVIIDGKSKTLSRPELRARRSWCRADRA